MQSSGIVFLFSSERAGVSLYGRFHRDVAVVGGSRRLVFSLFLSLFLSAFFLRCG